MSLQEFEEALAPAVFRMLLQIFAKPDGVPVQKEAAGEGFEEREQQNVPDDRAAFSRCRDVIHVFGAKQGARRESLDSTPRQQDELGRTHLPDILFVF